LIVDAPFLAFQIFTNSIICLYFAAFSNDFTVSNKNLINVENIIKLKEEFKKLGELNINMLHSNIWTLGEKYYSIIKELDNNNLKNYLVVDHLKNKIYDYGQSEIVEDGETNNSSRASPSEPSPNAIFTSNPQKEEEDNEVRVATDNDRGLVTSNTIDTNINELIQEFGYENWESFDMGNVLPGWNSVDLYSPNPA
jgi:hypothetical protein